MEVVLYVTYYSLPFLHWNRELLFSLIESYHSPKLGVTVLQIQELPVSHSSYLSLRLTHMLRHNGIMFWHYISVCVCHYTLLTCTYTVDVTFHFKTHECIKSTSHEVGDTVSPLMTYELFLMDSLVGISFSWLFVSLLVDDLYWGFSWGLTLYS